MSNKNKFSRMILALFLGIALFLSGCVSYKDVDAIIDDEPATVPTLPTVAGEESEPTDPPDSEEEPPASEYQDEGFFQSDTGTGLVLRLEWQAEQNPEVHQVVVGVQVYLEFEEDLILEGSTENTLTVGEEQVSFSTEDSYTVDQSPVLLHAGEFSSPRQGAEDTAVSMTCKLYFNSTYEEYRFKSLTAQGTVCVSDKYVDLPSRANLDVDVIKQHPELPNGCEVTSLAMALNYAGYKVGKMQLKNGYLPIGTENIYEYNIGDPEWKKGSYGCYSPVIKKTADAFFADRGIEDCVAVDLTHYNVSELYYRVSQGCPVIVWATQYMERRPQILTSWEENGLTFNWKAPLHCMLLTGYNRKAGTVTVTDPIYGVVTHDAELFELRWHQMGEQAVVLEPVKQKTEK